MSNPEKMQNGDTNYEAQIQALIAEGEAAIRKVRDDYRGRIAELKKRADSQAAWDLTMEDPQLRRDPEAMSVARSGKTTDGRAVSSVDEFLSGRKEVLAEGVTSFGPVKRKWNDISPDAAGTAHSEEEK